MIDEILINDENALDAIEDAGDLNNIEVENNFNIFVNTLLDASKYRYLYRLKLYKQYCNEFDKQAQNPSSVYDYVNFLRNNKEHKFAGSTLWSICSIIRSWFLHVHTMDLFALYPALKNLLKNYSKADKVKKASALSENELNEFMTNAVDDDKWLVRKVITIVYLHGLLRRSEGVYIKFCDLEIKQDIITINNIKRGK